MDSILDNRPAGRPPDEPAGVDHRESADSVDPVIHVVGAAILEPSSPDRPTRCLVAQRSATMPEPLTWEFPGGKVEDGEAPEVALVREIREELGLEVRVEHFLGRGEAEVSGGRRVEMDVYVVRLAEEPRAGETVTPRLAEHRDWRWIGADDVDRLAWAPADLPVLEALREVLSSHTSPKE